MKLKFKVKKFGKGGLHLILPRQYFAEGQEITLEIDEKKGEAFIEESFDNLQREIERLKREINSLEFVKREEFQELKNSITNLKNSKEIQKAGISEEIINSEMIKYWTKHSWSDFILELRKKFPVLMLKSFEEILENWEKIPREKFGEHIKEILKRSGEEPSGNLRELELRIGDLEDQIEYIKERVSGQAKEEEKVEKKENEIIEEITTDFSKANAEEDLENSEN